MFIAASAHSTDWRILGGVAAEERLVRVASAVRQLLDGEVGQAIDRLSEERELLRDLAVRELVQHLAVEQHDAALRLQDARQRTQQRRLAGAVRADEPGDAAVLDDEIDVLDDGSRAP